MKKILSSVAAVALAAALISCGESKDNTYNYSGAQDTVLTIGAPVVTAKAYAGVNYITWSPVAQADHYELIRTGDGVAGDQQKTIAATKATSFADVADTSNVLADGVVYKYTVIAVPANSTTAPVPQRAVYMQSNAGFASVTAYVPAAGTEITAFTDLYTKNFISANYKDADTIAKKAKLTFANDAIGVAHIVASFPATAGYKFGVKYINSTQPEYILKSKVAEDKDFTDLYLENYTANTASVAFPAPGKYKAYLTMKAVCGYYPTPVVYEVGDGYEVKELKATSKTTVDEIKYVAEKKVRLTWTPATLVSGSLAPIGNYKVYRTEGELTPGSTLTPVKGTVTAIDKYTNADANNIDKVVNAQNKVVSGSAKDTITKVYYVDEEVPANDVKYTFIIVNTADGEYENMSTTTEASAYTSVVLEPYAQETTDAPTLLCTPDVSKDGKNLYNQLKITAKRANTKQTLALYWIKLDESIDKYDAGEYTKTLNVDTLNKASLALANNDETEESWISYLDASKGVYLIKLTASEAGKAPQSKYEVVKFTGSPDPDVSGVFITASPNAAKKAYIYDTKVDSDTVGLFTYYLVTVKTTTGSAPNYKNYVTVSSKETKVTLEQVTVTGRSKFYGDANDSKYQKEGFPLKESKIEGADPDKYTYTSYPYAVVDSIEGETGVETVFSVKKVLNTDTSKYNFSDGSNNSRDSGLIRR